MTPLSFVGWALAIYVSAVMALNLWRELASEESIEEYLRGLETSEIYYAIEILEDEKRKRVKDFENSI